MFPGQLLGDNLCCGTCSSIRIVRRALENLPCNDASHIAFLTFSLLKFIFLLGLQSCWRGLVSKERCTFLRADVTAGTGGDH